MATGARALGHLFNVLPVFVPTDAVAGAITGLRVSMKDCQTVSFVLIAAAGSTDILDIDLQEHTAFSGGTSRDLDITTKLYYMDEATLDGDEVWTLFSQSAASESTDIGSASAQQLVVVEVGAEQLSDDAFYVSINVPDLGTNGTKFVSCVAIKTGLYAGRLPTAIAAQS